MTNIAQQTIAEIVTNDHRTATIFEKYHLDFCCKGKRSLAEACAEKGLSFDEVAAEINSLRDPGNAAETLFRHMTADHLVAYIVNRHHNYVKQIMPQLQIHIERVAQKHGDRFPYMVEVYKLFSEIKNDMTLHMQKEEMILFPAIVRAEHAFKNKGTLNGEVNIIRGAIQVMESEHDSAGELMLKIRELTNGYEETEGACTTFRLSLAELKAFEEDLHQHVHLENNILFPMAQGFIE